MARHKTVTDANLELALRKNAGIKSLAANAVGITRQAVQDRVAKSERLQRVLVEIEETTMDMAEGVILSGIRAKDKQTARWYAERKGKGRGYASKTELSISDDDLEAVVAAFGGNLDALRRLRTELAGVAQVSEGS